MTSATIPLTRLWEIIQQRNSIEYALLTPTLTIAEASEGFLRLAQVSDWQDQPIASVIHEFAGLEHALHTILAGERETLELPRIVHDMHGESVNYLRLTVSPVSLEQPSEGLLVLVEDDTELGHLEQQLARERYQQQTLRTQLLESEMRYRQIVEGASDVVCLIDTDGHFTYVNQPTTRLTGYSEIDLIGMHYSELIPETMRNRITSFYQNQLSERIRETLLELPIKTRDGEERWVDQRVTLIDRGGHITGFQGVLRDITDRRHIKNALVLQQRRLRSLYELSTLQGLAINTTFTIALKRVIELLNLDTGLITQVDEEGDHHIAHVYGGDLERGSLFTPIEGEFREVIAAADVAQSVYQNHVCHTEHEVSAYIGVPIWIGQEHYGVLALFSREPREQPFNEADRDFIRMLVQWVSNTIERRRIGEAEREQRILAEALRDVATALNSTLDLDEVLELMLANIGRVVLHDAANIMLVEDGKAKVVRAQGYADRIGGDILKQSILINNLPLLQAMAGTNQPVIISDMQRFDAWSDLPDFMSGGSYAGTSIFNTEGDLIGYLNLLSDEAGFFTQKDAERLRAFTDQAALAIENARLYRRAHELAAVEERQRIARELHDAVSQTLFSASVLAGTLPLLWERSPDEARAELSQLQRLTRGALAEMRTLLLELRPQALTDTPPGDLLRHLTEAAASRSRFSITLNLKGSRSLPPDVQLVLYRVAQQALNNVIKHAKASNVDVTLTFSSTGFDLVVWDDGIGFSPDEIPPDRMGVSIMHERASSIDADVTVKSSPEQGTEVRLIWQEH